MIQEVILIGEPNTTDFYSGTDHVVILFEL